MNKGQIYAEGLRLNFFESSDFEYENKEKYRANAEIIARNALRLLMMGWRDDWKSVASGKLFKAVFIEKDPELIAGVRRAFQQGFHRVFEQLQDRELSSAQLNQARLYLSNCMALLPLADINPDESIAIPQFIENSWQLVDYKVVPIELTPVKGFNKLFIHEQDRVFAYGLEPINNNQAEPHLIFMEKSYPAGQGYNTLVYASKTIFEPPGQFLYRNGRENIRNWLDKQDKKVHVCGDGSLPLILACDQGYKLSRVDTLSSTGVALRKKNPYDNWHYMLKEEKPQVIIQKKGFGFGRWKWDWDLIQAVPGEDQQSLKGFVTSSLNYAESAETRFVGVACRQDNRERKKHSSWLSTAINSLIFMLGLLPYHYIILPLARYVNNHKLLLSITILMVLASLFMPPLGPVLTPTVLLIGALLPLGINLSYKLCKAVLTILGFNEIKTPPCHSSKLARNKEANIYANEIEESFTYQEIKDYYTARRCILHGKPFLPTSNQEEERYQIKRDLLEKASNPGFANEKVVIKKSKAKIYEIKKTNQLRGRYNFYQLPSEDGLKRELEEQYAAYTSGKR